MSTWRTQRPWRKQKTSSTSPEAVIRELNARELRNLETCRAVWENELDPLALCEAIRLADLPDWLADSLLVVVTGRLAQAGFPTQKLWDRRRRHAEKKVVAGEVAGVRSHPDVDATWDDSYGAGGVLAEQEYADMPRTGMESAKAAYHEVRRNLPLAPYRYFRARPGMQERIRDSLRYLIGLLKAQRSDRDGSKVVTGHPPSR